MARVTVKSSDKVPFHLSRIPSRSKTSRRIPVEPPQQKLPLMLGPSAEAIEAFHAERISEAETVLMEASRMGRVGSLQLEAAIQSAHVQGRRSGARNDREVAMLYDALIRVAPTLGARVAHAVAVSNVEGPQSGLTRLDAIERCEDYQPYWSARAHVMAQLGRTDDARDAYERAAGLSEDEGARRWLMARRRAL